MAKDGKHAIKGKHSEPKAAKKSVGAHAISKRSGKDSSFGLQVERERKKVTADFSLANILKAILLLAICFLMITPLKGCLLTDTDYIGSAEAQKIALDDSGLPGEKVSDAQCDLVKIDGEVYYKIQFKGTVTDYRYVIDADSGEIVARSFYHIDGEN